MLTHKEKQLIKKIKAKRRLHRLRKKTLSVRKKTISLQKSRWLRGASSEQLPLLLSTKPALRQLYLSARSKLTIECKVTRRFSKATSKSRTRAKREIVTKSATTPAKSATFNSSLNSWVFGQKQRQLSATRKLHKAFATVRSASAVKKAAGCRRYLRRCKYQINLLLHRPLLRRVAQKLYARVAQAKRFSLAEAQYFHRAGTISRSNDSLLATAKQRLRAARTAAVSKRKPATRNNGYKSTLNRTIRLAGSLKILRTRCKQQGTAKLIARKTAAMGTYSRAKESLRSRFFRRKALMLHAVRTAAATKLDSTKASAYSRNARKRSSLVTTRPHSRELSALAARLSLQQVASILPPAPTFSKQPSGLRSALRRLPRRSKRVLAVARREIKRMSKHGQKRRRRSALSRNPSKRVLINLARTSVTGREVSLKTPSSRWQRGSLLKGLLWIRTAQRKFITKEKTTLPLAARRIVTSNHPRQSRRLALWALLRAITYAKDKFTLPPLTLQALDALAMELRRGLRCGRYSNDRILSNFLFLLRVLTPNAVAQKKLYLSLQHWQTAGSSPAVARRCSSKVFRGANALTLTGVHSGRYPLRAGLIFNTPRPLVLVQPTPVPAAVTFTRAALCAEITPFAVKLTVPAESAGELPAETTEEYAGTHGVALASMSTHQKKRLLPRLAKRQSRFTRFIPSRSKSRLLRKMVTARNKDLTPSPRFPVVRFFNQFYTKGNRVFATRYTVGYRVAAKRLVKPARWSRATLLRLSRRRPAWRRVPQGRQSKSSTGRINTSAPYIGVNKGWRARKGRIKQRRLLRAQAERFKALILHTGPSCLSTAAAAQTNLPPRVLQLVTGRGGALRSAGTPVTSASVFHVAQRRLAVQRASRATQAKAVFGLNTLRLAGDQYTRKQGRFLPTGSRERKHPRRPRWVRLLAKTSTQVLNFSRLSPLSTHAKNSTFTRGFGRNMLQLRTRLWAGVGRQQHVRTVNVKDSARVTPMNPDQHFLIKKLRRLALLKSLLLANKFDKLARLGELKALGEHKYLGGLSKLAELGSVTEELKLQLLLRLAVDIKRYATLCVAAPNGQQETAVTARASSRALFTRSKVLTVTGRSTSFFQPSAPKKKMHPALHARKVTLLKALARVSRKKVGPRSMGVSKGNSILARTTWTNRATAARTLRRYHRTLRLKGPSADNLAEQLDSLGALTKRVHPYVTKQAYNLQSCQRGTAYFTPSAQLSAVYNKKTVGTVTTPCLWVTRLGRWVKSTSPSLRLQQVTGETLPKSFSTVRPWGAKVVYSGSIAKEYKRFLDGAQTELSALKRRSTVSGRKTKVKPPVSLFYLRRASARAIYTQRAPKVLHVTSAASGDQFWQLRLQPRDDVQLQTEQRLKALARMQRKVVVQMDSIPPRRASRRLVKTQKVTPLAKKVVTTAPITTRFTSYYINCLDLNVFDRAVRDNLQKYCNLAPQEREGQQGYDFVRRAYKAAISCHERNPKLPQLQFERQKAALVPYLTRLGGVVPTATVLEWNKLPKNKALSQYKAPASSSTAGYSAAVPGSLTASEIEGIRDEATKKHLKSFSSTPVTARQNAEAYLLVKKAVLHSWTRVEESATPKESPYYNDLLLAAKAYKFYGVTLDLTSRVATNAKLAATFAKLHK